MRSISPLTSNTIIINYHLAITIKFHYFAEDLKTKMFGVLAVSGLKVKRFHHSISIFYQTLMYFWGSQDSFLRFEDVNSDQTLPRVYVFYSTSSGLWSNSLTFHGHNCTFYRKVTTITIDSLSTKMEISK